jgi:hypothetical protein
MPYDLGPEPGMMQDQASGPPPAMQPPPEGTIPMDNYSQPQPQPPYQPPPPDPNQVRVGYTPWSQQPSTRAGLISGGVGLLAGLFGGESGKAFGAGMMGRAAQTLDTEEANRQQQNAALKMRVGQHQIDAALQKMEKLQSIDWTDPEVQAVLNRQGPDGKPLISPAVRNEVQKWMDKYHEYSQSGGELTEKEAQQLSVMYDVFASDIQGVVLALQKSQYLGRSPGMAMWQGKQQEQTELEQAIMAEMLPQGPPEAGGMDDASRQYIARIIASKIGSYDPKTRRVRSREEQAVVMQEMRAKAAQTLQAIQNEEAWKRMTAQLQQSGNLQDQRDFANLVNTMVLVEQEYPPQVVLQGALESFYKQKGIRLGQPSNPGVTGYGGGAPGQGSPAPRTPGTPPIPQGLGDFSIRRR